MIKNIADLAQYLEASAETEAAIQHRIFKSTSCGCSSSVEENKVLEKYHRNYLRTYVVQVRSGIGGSYVVAWRREHRKKHYIRLSSNHCPPALAEYLGLQVYDMRQEHSSNWYNYPRIGEEWVGRNECHKEFGAEFLRALKPDTVTPGSPIEGTTKITRRGGSTYLTLNVRDTKDASGRGTVFSVAGYTEGTDRECTPHEVLLPCMTEEVDLAILVADQDGCDLWNETHGCYHCYPEGYCDEVGNEWAPDGDNWIGQPINPECVTCQGLGTII